MRLLTRNLWRRLAGSGWLARWLGPKLALVALGAVIGASGALAFSVPHRSPVGEARGHASAASPHRSTKPTATQTGRAGATASPSPVQAPAATSGPVRLQIPAIGVDANVEQVGVTPQHNMDTPQYVDDVGWYDAGPQPGATGDAVIDGHKDWTTGPAVFWNLSKLHAGDEIKVVFADGHLVGFKVTNTTSVPYDQPPPGLFATDGPARLTLITCAGQWDGTQYQQRLVVDAAPA